MEWVTEGAVIFLSHAFCHPLTTFGVLVIFLHTPGFGASVFGFAYAVTGRVFDSLACYALTGRYFAAPPRATGCRPPGSIIPRTPCDK